MNPSHESHSFGASSVPQPQEDLIIANTLSGDNGPQYSGLYTQESPESTSIPVDKPEKSRTEKSGTQSERVAMQDVAIAIGENSTIQTDI